MMLILMILQFVMITDIGVMMDVFGYDMEMGWMDKANARNHRKRHKFKTQVKRSPFGNSIRPFSVPPAGNSLPQHRNTGMKIKLPVVDLFDLYRLSIFYEIFAETSFESLLYQYDSIGKSYRWKI